jgi:XTP/dITP diphosphohydrolase
LALPKLVLASRNKGKLQELRELLADTGWEVRPIGDYPDVPEVDEDGATFRENAVKKATETAHLINEWVLADDSGLEVDALGGEPGVHSARFTGVHGDDHANNQLLLERLRNVEASRRTARFRCVTALAAPDGRVWTADGTCDGRIGEKPVGEHGFGYDPLFVLDSGRTMAELSETEKNRISHRARAMQAMRKILAELAEKL